MSDELLPQVGIATPEDLERLGSVEAYRRLWDRHPGRWNVVGLFALEGALLDLHWNDLPHDRREELRGLAHAIRTGQDGVVDPGFRAPPV